MSIYARPSGSFEATVNGAVTGLVGTITVGIYDGQGGTTTAPTTAGIIESPAGSGVYTATLTAPSVTGQYSVTWFDGTAYAVEDLLVSGSVVGGTPPVPGGSYPTPTELKAKYTELSGFSDGIVQDAINLAVEAFEHAADVAFAPRSETLTLTPSEPGRISLPRARVTSVNSVTGSASGAITVDGQIIAGGLFVNANPWLTTETLTVDVTHGYADTPLEVAYAVGLLARRRILRGGLDDRATQQTGENGGIINLATPGMFGSEFGIPDVDAVLRRYRHHALVP